MLCTCCVYVEQTRTRSELSKAQAITTQFWLYVRVWRLILKKISTWEKYALINAPCGAWDFSRKLATMARKFNSENYKQKTQRHKEKLRTIEKNKGNGLALVSVGRSSTVLKIIIFWNKFSGHRR